MLTVIPSPTFTNHLTTNENNRDIYRVYSKYLGQQKSTKNPPPMESLF